MRTVIAVLMLTCALFMAGCQGKAIEPVEISVIVANEEVARGSVTTYESLGYKAEYTATVIAGETVYRVRAWK